jgi:hypothetical protein
MDTRHRLRIDPGSLETDGFEHWWRTEEEKLARTLARNGHKVVLLHIER